MSRLFLVAAILLYRLVPFRPNCPRAGESCSVRGLAAARAGLGLAGVLAVIGTCTAQTAGEGCLNCPDPPSFCIRVWETLPRPPGTGPECVRWLP